MTKKIVLLAVTISLVLGVIVGMVLTAKRVEAQSRMSRFYTEREGELLFIRYTHSGPGGVDCYLAVANTGIIGVPCNLADMRSGRN